MARPPAHNRTIQEIDAALEFARGSRVAAAALLGLGAGLIRNAISDNASLARWRGVKTPELCFIPVRYGDVPQYEVPSSYFKETIQTLLRILGPERSAAALEDEADADGDRYRDIEPDDERKERDEKLKALKIFLAAWDRRNPAERLTFAAHLGNLDETVPLLPKPRVFRPMRRKRGWTQKTAETTPQAGFTQESAA